MSAPAGSDDPPEDLEAVFAALPPPDAFQRDAGWSRDWSRVWAPHEEKLAATRHLHGEALLDAFRSRPDHVSPSGRGRVLFFDVTGGPKVRLAKERARCEQIRRETEVARIAKERLEDERKRETNVPDVTRVTNQPLGVLHPTGASIPLVGLGTWKSTEPGVARVAVEEALRAGYLHVDCASVYDNEDEVGDGMAEVFTTTKLRRRDVFVTSKLWNDAHFPNDVEPACRASLNRLRVGYLDLYLMHWPVADKPKDGKANDDKESNDTVEPPLLDTWRAMERLVDLGLVKHIGVSNFSAKKLQSLVSNARHPVSVCQVECHPFWRQDRLLAYCEENNIHFTAYSPLGSPDSAAMFRGRTKVPAVMQDETVRAVAERAGRNVGQVLLRWALQTRPHCSVLPKSANKERLRSNLDVFDWCLPEEDVRLIDAVAPRHRMVDGSFWLSPKGPYKTLEDLWDE
jgi:diketogulonate reductase-like aldo/keto reductase